MNQLFYGDNLDILRKKVHDETIDLCYIDPPFNSKRNYNQIYNNIGNEDQAQAQAFIDTWVWNDRARDGFLEILANEQGRFRPQTVELIKGLDNVLGRGSLLAYLVSIALRVTEVHRVLKDTGTFFLHCDPTASHYLKLVCDGIFCADQAGDFKNEIVWRRTGSHNARRSFGPIHDIIFFYTKTNKYHFKIVNRPYMRGHVESRYTLDEETGKLKFTSGGNVLTGAGATGGESGKPWHDFDPSAKNRHWAIPGFLAEQMGDGFQELSVLEKLDALYDAGLIDIEKGNAWPTPVRFLTEKSGAPIQDIWAYQPYTEGTVYGTDRGIDADVAWLGTTDPERLGYQTQKPIGLLDRIIRSACPEGGSVLDAYCGCGTTIAVAQALGCEWTGIDITYQSISVVLKRLEDRFGKSTVEAVALDGIPRDMESAHALAHKTDDRLRKEFEKWATLTYTNNRAIINEKKGADAGIDGRAYFMTGKSDNAKIIFQVKSGGVERKDIATLRGDMDADKAALGVLITLEEPTKPMLKAAKAAGRYRHEMMGRDYDRISVVTIREMLEEGKRLEIPMSMEVLKAAQRASSEDQPSLHLTPAKIL
jgi:DNA modification methylase